MRAFLLSVTVALLCSLGGVAHAAPADWGAMHLTSIDGKALDTGALKGHVVLFVNVASFCGYSVQYSDLEALYKQYNPQGLVVVGVPCNQFGSQEPGSDQEIKNFCSTRFGVTFPMLSKQEVNGSARSALYAWLVGSKAGASRDVGWNFEKFLVGRNGEVVARFASHVVPNDPSLRAAIEYALATGA
jgi:glutathione peroxidase